MKILRPTFMRPTFLVYMALFIASQLLAFSNVSAQEVYKSVDENGKVTFSDSPGSDGEKVDVKPTNILPAATVRRLDPGVQQEQPKNYRLRLVSPAHEQRFGPKSGRIAVEASLNKDLEPGHFYVFFMDGQRIAPPGRFPSASIPLTLKSRGKKTISAAIIDSKGKRVVGSNSATVYVIRPN